MNKIKYFFTQFLPEVKAEWKKVTSPNRREVAQTTVVVVVTSFIFAVFLWVADRAILFAYEGALKLLGVGS
jgi:preprotein translocase subunit SecE